MEQNGNWACSGCTFLNHPDLKACEICDTVNRMWQIESNSEHRISQKKRKRQTQTILHFFQGMTLLSFFLSNHAPYYLLDSILNLASDQSTIQSNHNIEYSPKRSRTRELDAKHETKSETKDEPTLVDQKFAPCFDYKQFDPKITTGRERYSDYTFLSAYLEAISCEPGRIKKMGYLTNFFRCIISCSQDVRKMQSYFMCPYKPQNSDNFILD